MKWKSESRIINTGFIIALLILLSSITLWSRLFSRDIADELLLHHSYRVLQTSTELFSNLKDVETGSRGFLLTGDENYLKLFNSSAARNESFIRTLRILADNPQQLKRYLYMQNLVEELLSLSNTSIRLRQEKGIPTRLLSTNAGAEKRIMDKLRSVFSQIEQEEQKLLLIRQHEAQQTKNVIDKVFICGIIASCSIFFLIFYVLRRQIKVRVESEQELFIKNEWFTQTLASLGDGVITTDTEGVITLINKAACGISKWENSDAIGKHIDVVFGLFNERSGQQVMNPALEALQKNKIIFLDDHTILKAKDGTRIYIDDCGAPITNDMGKVIGAVLIVRNITEKKKAEEEKTEYKNFLEAILENIPSMIFIKDALELKYLRINKAGEELLGYSREELLGKSNHDFFKKEEADFFRSKDLEVLEKGSLLDIPEEVIHTKGGERWLYTRKIPIFNEKGDTVFLLGISEDITEKRKLEAEIKNINSGLEEKVKERTAEIISQKKFTENILNNIPNDIAVFDKSHHYLFVNPGAISKEENRNWIIGKNDFDYCKFKGLDNSRAFKRRQVFEKAIETRRSTEWVEEHIGPQGEKKFVLRKFHPIFENDVLINVIGYGLDITELKEAEQVKREYILALEEMMFMTSHKVRQPVSQIMGISELLESEIVSQEELKKITGFMKESVHNLDSFTRELTTFINDLREKNEAQQRIVEKDGPDSLSFLNQDFVNA